LRAHRKPAGSWHPLPLGHVRPDSPRPRPLRQVPDGNAVCGGRVVWRPIQGDCSMSDLLVIAFDDEATGFQLRAELVKMQREYLIALEDAVVVTRDGENVKLHQAVNLTAAGAAG